MADTANATPAQTPAKSGKKKVAAKKPAKPAQHPKYNDMVVAAITALKERNGSSRQAILNYIMANFKVTKDQKTVNTHVKIALKSGVNKKVLKQTKGTGASGSFRVSDNAPVKPKKPSAKKPSSAVKKDSAKKKPVKKSAPKTKKTAAKKSPKKTSAKKTPKKPAAKKSPKKSASKKSSKKSAKK